MEPGGTWRGIDEKLVQRVVKALAIALRRQGYRTSPGRGWVFRKLNSKASPLNQNWGDGKVFEANIDTLAEAARKWMYKRGVRPIDEAELDHPANHSDSALEGVFSTARYVYPLVVDIRKLLWGTPKPPFSDDEGGHVLASEWFERAGAGDASKLKSQRRGKVEISLVLETVNVEKLISKTTHWRIEQQKNDRISSGREITNSLLDAISEVDRCSSAWHVASLHVESADDQPHLQLEFTSSKGLDKKIAAFPDTRSEELAARVSYIANKAKSWTNKDILNFILYGVLPDPKAEVIVQGQKNNSVELTVTVNNSTPKSKLVKQYREVLDTLGLYKPLSHTQEAVLMLVDETPNLSWGQRYKKWLEWCDRFPDLPDFNRNPKSGPPSLYKTHQRAVAKYVKLAAAKM